MCHQFLELMSGNPDTPGNILISNEAHFHLHDTLNKQKFVIGLLKIYMTFTNLPSMTWSSCLVYDVTYYNHWTIFLERWRWASCHSSVHHYAHTIEIFFMLIIHNLVGYEKSMYGFSKIVKRMARISMAVSHFFFCRSR